MNQRDSIAQTLDGPLDAREGPSLVISTVGGPVGVVEAPTARIASPERPDGMPGVDGAAPPVLPLVGVVARRIAFFQTGMEPTVLLSRDDLDLSAVGGDLVAHRRY